jgi:hypothetical protein
MQQELTAAGHSATGYRVVESENHCVVAVWTAAAAFDSERRRREINIEVTGRIGKFAGLS